jgi:TonB family protein
MRFPIAAAFAAALLNVQDGRVVSPARYVSGNLPVAPVLAVSGGQVFVEALVAPDGRVASVEILRTTPPFTDALVAAVRSWQFVPAAIGSTPVPARVFVAATFAAPALFGPTLGQPPQDVLAAGNDVPAPTATVSVGYPPDAMGNGTVLVGVTVTRAGRSEDARVLVSSPAFDRAALAAARAWSFRPARRDGKLVSAFAYLVFSFRQPVISGS